MYCPGKICYPSPGVANRNIRRRRKEGRRMRAYHCTECKAWHLTSK